MPHKRKRGAYAGWFVEVPKELKEKFDELYPTRRSKRLLTIAFIQWAIRMKPDLEALAVVVPLVPNPQNLKPKPTTNTEEDARGIGESSLPDTERAS